MTYYTISKPATTYYNVFRTSVRTWVEIHLLSSWSILCDMGLDTWFKLYAAKIITVYHAVSNPSTTYYEVT